MKNGISILGSLGIGAGLMYMFDPDRGKRRRAMLRDESLHLSKRAARQLRQAAYDINNRAYGTFAEAKARFSSPEVSDEKLASRIKSRSGRLTTHPRLIKAAVEDGRVTVSGPILADEADRLLRGISRVPGVRAVEDRLERHTSDEKFRPLQNPRKNRRGRLGRWPIGTRLLSAVAGGGLTVYAFRRGGLLGQVLGTAGVGLITRGLTDRSFKELVRGDGGFHIQKSIRIDAPVEKVFHFCSHPENFPQFMSHVRLVEPLGRGQYRWTVDGVPGLPLTWETRVTEVEPNRKIAWESIPEARVVQHGDLRLEPLSENQTRVSINLRYTPPAGVLGHAVAAFFHRDPKSEMDDDLIRMKTFIEKGKVPHDAAAMLRYKGGKSMKVSEIMTKDPVCCRPQTSLQEAAHMMLENDCGAIPVVENLESRKPVGIITDRDITIDTVAHGKNPLEMTVAEIMSFPVVTVNPEMSVDDCCTVMEENMIRRVIVVDESGACCGIVAQADVARNAPWAETAELVQDVSMESHAATT